MKLPAIPKSSIKKADEVEVLTQMLRMVTDHYFRVIKHFKSGDHIAFYFCIKRGDAEGNGIPINDRNSKEYRLWREMILRRDGYRCVECHAKDVPLHADHIKPYYSHKELRLDLDNGQTLCLNCHGKKHPHLGFAKTWMKQNEANES